MPDQNPRPITSANSVADILAHHHIYALARVQFLKLIQQQGSCRDPHAELSELLVAKLLNAKIATSRVQKGYDLIRPNSRHVQVKYLCNPGPGWINEHHIQFADGVDDYALVIITGFDLEAVLVFPKETLVQVGKRLKKRHPNQDRTLQFTKQNYRAIISNPSEFLELGMEIHRFQRE